MVPPRIVFLNRNDHTFAGEAFLPRLENFANPYMYTLVAIDEKSGGSINFDQWPEPSSKDHVKQISIRIELAITVRRDECF